MWNWFTDYIKRLRAEKKRDMPVDLKDQCGEWRREDDDC